MNEPLEIQACRGGLLARDIISPLLEAAGSQDAAAAMRAMIQVGQVVSEIADSNDQLDNLVAWLGMQEATQRFIDAYGFTEAALTISRTAYHNVRDWATEST